MRRLLLLGGSAQQVVAIETAKRLGYYTILCDYLPDNPGQYVADKFYQVSTTDKGAILQVAINEHIDGILAYASDPAAPTAAYVAAKLDLPCNPYESVEILCNKDRFRAFLAANGFNAPMAAGYSDKAEALADADRYTLPVIVKPVDSSGSKGATVIRSWDELDQAIDHALEYSRSHRVIVEEYIERKHPYLIGGDIFVADGKVILWGLMNCHRDSRVNPLVPVGKSYPLELSDDDLHNVQDILQRMMTLLGIRFGSVNVELVIDQNDRVWPIDIGPRAGGNMIPDLLGMIFNVNVVEWAVLTAMGEQIPAGECIGSGYYATHNLHSVQDGIFRGVRYSSELEPHVIRECIYKIPGDQVEYFSDASKAIGIVFFRFNDRGTLMAAMQNINENIQVILTRGGDALR